MIAKILDALTCLVWIILALLAWGILLVLAIWLIDYLHTII